ncbi:kyphoscoliosis peptidase-like isoform X1 [Penaeus japonicus]|uniref:kyphoscoliosis peptidase-like isoform X1 n=1 Tax=Penaeus japonicus TaxID=27405 RepID=UPI001C70FB27|nr:kyphoscoliosis peptidase-like isoform X1 [Penaeus japonicus]
MGVAGVSEPLLAPLEAWCSNGANADSSRWFSKSETKVLPWPSKSGAIVKLSWAAMMEAAIQTEAVSEEELDWDLSGLVDRETQTLPPNATHFQLNHTDAFVQTDYRYFPLASTDAARPSTSLTLAVKVSVGTQTDTMTNSVSTQTEEPYLLPEPPPPVTRPSTSVSVFEKPKVVLSDACSGPSTSGLGSALTRAPVLQGGVVPVPPGVLPISPPPSPEHPLSHPFDHAPPGRMKAEERWRHLANFQLDELLPSRRRWPVRQLLGRRRMIDVSIQTDNDILTDEAPQFAARPPLSKKVELLEGIDFTDLDVHILTAPDEVTSDTEDLVRYLCGQVQEDLQRLRVIFRWVTDNIRYDWKFIDKPQTAQEILSSRAGVSKDYVNLLMELCHLAGIRVKKIHGFAKGHDFRIGRRFDPETDPPHFWIAVFLYGSWRLLDPTFGAGYVDAQGRYHPHLQEHFFLTDPDQLIYTHFPYDQHELNYNRWQLLEAPISLEDFNALPKVMPGFWEVGLRLNKPMHCPVVFRQQTEVKISASTLIRYKYKFFRSNETEDACINQWVFCTLKEDNAMGSFIVVPPEPAEYILKVYAGPEELLDDENAALDHAVTFLLVCEKARRHPVPWPLHDVAWGPTPRLYECGLDPLNQSGPVIVTWGGKKLIYFDKAFEILIMFQVFDAEGHMLEVKGIIGKDETEEQLRLAIIPPGIGYYKFLMYGIPRPQVRGSVVCVMLCFVFFPDHIVRHILLKLSCSFFVIWNILLWLFPPL